MSNDITRYHPHLMFIVLRICLLEGYTWHEVLLLSHKINIRPKIWYRHTVLSSMPFYGMPKLQVEHTLELPCALFNITHATAIFQEWNPEHSTPLYATSNEKILSASVIQWSVQKLCNRMTHISITQALPERHGSKLCTWKHITGALHFRLLKQPQYGC